MSAAALSRAAGVAPSTLYDLERGDMRTSTKLHRIAEALKVSTEWLETGRGPRTPPSSDKNSEQKAQYSVHGFMISAPAARIAAEWEKLENPMRAHVALIIESLVATQIRAELRNRLLTQQESSRP